MCFFPFNFNSSWLCRFSFSLTWDTMGAKISKHYSSFKSLLNLVNFFLNFFSQWSSQNAVLEFWNVEFTTFSLTWGPMGAKTSKHYCYSSLKLLLHFSKLLLNFLLRGPNKCTGEGFKKKMSLRFSPFLFVFVNMGPYGSKNFKTLLLPQITIDYFETTPEFSSQ